MVVVALVLLPAQLRATTLTEWLAEQFSPLTVKLLSVIANSIETPSESSNVT